MEQEVVEEYTASLADLTFNSKPLINMLTMLAEDNAQYSEQIVQVIEAHMQKVSADKKLPALYLMDSIMKNVRQSNYLQLFAKNIVNDFVRVFEKVDEKRRQAMFKLRQTWADICPAKKLYALDVRVNQIDPAWPVTAPPPEKNIANIHINPRFLVKNERDEEAASRKQAEEACRKQADEAIMRQQLLSKQQELLQLQQKRLELELATARSQLQQQAEQNAAQTVLAAAATAQSVPLQVLPIPEVEPVPAVNHFTPQALVAPQPSTAPLTIPTTAWVNQQDPRLARDPRLAHRDPRSPAAPQWQTAVVHPAVQSKPQEGQTLLVATSSSSDESVLSSSKSDVSLDTKECKDDKAKKPAEKPTEKSAKKSTSTSAKKEDESVLKKIEQKPDKDTSKKDDKPSTSGATTKTGEGAQKATSSASSNHEKRTSRASSHSRSRSHAGDRNKEKDAKTYKDTKAKSSKDDARSRSRSPRTTRLPREHLEYDRRYSKRSSLNADRRRRSHEGSPTDKKETMSLRSGDKHKLGRGMGHPLENSVWEARPWKDKADRAHVEATGSKATDNTDAGPAAKRQKRQGNGSPANEKHEALSDDLVDLFGKEDKDYRMMGPPVTPKLDMQAARALRNSVDFVLPSPKQEEWKRFKESRPEDFPFVQPGSSAMDVDIRTRDVDLRQPLMSPPGVGMGSMRRPYMPRIPKVVRRDEGKDLVIPKQLRLDQAESVLRQAEEQVKLGTLSPAAHEDLKVKLKRLYILQKIRQDGRVEMDENRPPHDRFNGPNPGYFNGRGNAQKQFWGPGPARHGRNEERMGSPAHFMEGSNSPHHDTDERRSNRGPIMPTPCSENDFVEGQNMRPPHAQHHPPNCGPRFEQDRQFGFRGGRPFQQTEKQMPLLPPPLPPLHHHPHQQPLLPSPGNNPQDPPREFSFTDQPWYDTDRHYVFEHDKRWMMRVRQHFDSRKSNEVVIDGKSYKMTNNQPHVIPIGNERVEVRIDLNARRVFVGPKICYWIGSPEIMETINGQRHLIYFRGPIKRLWIDGHQFELWMDAPPEKVTIANIEYSMQINSVRGVVLVNDTVVCPLSEESQIVNIGNNKHEIHFNQPSKQILIDGKLCKLNFSGKFPIVIINGKAHGIRFDGGPREILINGKPWTVTVDMPRRARLAGPRPYLIALGGPGHEVIIEDQWYVVKFNGPEVFFTLGNRKFRLQLKGLAPEVKILGEVITPEQAVKLFGPNPMQPTLQRPLLVPPHGMVEHSCNEPGFRHGGGPPFRQLNDGVGPQGRPGFPSPHRDESFQGRRNTSVPSLLDMDVKPSMVMKNEPLREGPPHGMGGEPRGPGPEFTCGPRPNLLGQPRFEGPRGPFPDTRPNMAMGGPHDGPNPPFMGPGMDQPVRPVMGDMNMNVPTGMMPGQGGMMPNKGGMMPGQSGMMQNQGGMMPGQSGMMQNQGGMVPNQGGMMPNQSGMMPNQGGMMQNQGGMMPNQGGMMLMVNSQQQPMPGGPTFLQAGGMGSGGMQVGGGGMPGQMVPGQLPNKGGMNFMQQQQQPQQMMMPGANPVSAIPGMMLGPGGVAPQLQPMNSQVDVDDLLTKLMAAGIINKDEPKAEVKAEVKDEKEVDDKTQVKEELKKLEEIKFEDVPDLTDFDIQRMKTCYNGVLQRLYTGVQCSSCGVRFTATDTEQYREHLDWHFRQNRKEKEEIKVAKFRRWYYAAADWIQFEEIGDTEENAQSNYFENMMQLAQEQQGFGNLPGQTELISCPAALGNEKDDVCTICGDPFEQFWDEEQEAWHLKDAIRVSDETYHPVCYEDAKESGLAEGLTTPDAQQQQQQQQQLEKGGQQQQQQPPPDPITNPLAYLKMLNQQKRQDCTVAVPTTAGAVTIKQEPTDTSATIRVTVISSGQPPTVTAAAQGTPVTVKCENVPATTCVGQSSSSTLTTTSTTAATPSLETVAKQTDSMSAVPEPTDVPKS